MNIAILGWGSLIWDRRELSVMGEWQKDGPVLPIEFSRISNDGRLTLVIDEENGVPVQTRYAQSGSGSLSQAIENLRKREGSLKNMIGVVSQIINNSRDGYEIIKAWAEDRNWDAVIWTGLPSNFAHKTQVSFTESNGLNYLKKLEGIKKTKAKEYIEQAPEEIDTPLCSAIALEGWAVRKKKILISLNKT